VSNATDVAKAAASVILLTEGLSGILILIRVGRSIHRRIVTWIVNKISKTLQTTQFVVLSFFITGSFPITAFDMVLLLLLIDFVTISLATDRVRVNPQPERWDIPRLTRIAALISLISAGQAIGLLMVAVYRWELSESQVNTFSFELLYFFGICTTFIAREDQWFFSSLPSPLLIAVCVVDVVVVVTVCSVEVPELTGIAFWQAIIVPVYTAGCSFLLNDPCKVLYYKWAARSSTALQGLQAAEMPSAPTTSPDDSLHVDAAERAVDQTALRVSV
jgi:H+-transporting ATPase